MNTVWAGPVATDLWLGAHGVAATASKASGANAEAVAAGAAAQSVTGRFTQPGEVADLVLYLASDRGLKHRRRELHHRRRSHHDALKASS